MPSTAPKYYVEKGSGKFLGIFVGFQPPDEPFVDRDGALILIDGNPVVRRTFSEIKTIPERSIEVPFPPDDGRDVWDGAKYIPHIEPPPAPVLATLLSLLMKKGLITELEIAAEANQEGKAK